MHARAYKNIGYTVRACTNVTQDKGRAFAAEHGAEFVERYEDRLPSSRGRFRRRLHVSIVQARRRARVRREPQAGPGAEADCRRRSTTAREMIDVARDAGIVLGVVSQHRFDRASLFLSSAIRAGPARQAAAVRRVREVVALRRVLRAAGEGKLGDRRRRSADQSGDSSGRSAAVVCRTRSRGVRHVAARRRPHDRVRRHRQCGDAL